MAPAPVPFAIAPAPKTKELAQVADENESRLNEQQLEVYNAIKEAVHNETGELIGLQASGRL